MDSVLRSFRLNVRVIYNEFRRWRIKRCLRRAAWLCAEHERGIVTDAERIIRRLERASRIERAGVHVMTQEDTAAIDEGEGRS